MRKHAEYLRADIRRALEQGRVHDAYTLAIYQNPQESHPYIRGIDEGDMLRALQTKPPALDFMDVEHLHEVQIRVAMAYAGCHCASLETLPGWPYRMSIKTAVHVLYMASEVCVNLDEWQRSGIVEQVRVCCSGDGPCDVCAAYRDGGPYRLESAPAPPFRDCLCLHERGCRCILVAHRILGIDC